MIFIERPAIDDVLDEPARKHRELRKGEAASLAPHSKVITSRWDSFRGGDGKDKDVGPRICNTIKTFCRGKCAYCESPSAPTIDHVWPKQEHPKKMFDWDNLLAAFRDCNSEKRAEFRIDEKQKALMIDPTQDEPLVHFRWDARTGKCLYEETNVRAAETARNIDVDRFSGERFAKLGLVKWLFARCIQEKPVSNDLRERVRQELEPSRPYLCILRSYLLYPVHDTDRVLVRGAIHAVAEILTWVRPWLHPPGDVSWPP